MGYLDILLQGSPADRKKALLSFAGFLVASFVLAFVMVKGGVPVAVMILLLPFILIFMVASFNKPVIALYVLFVFGFTIFMIDRYFLKGAMPIGTLVDGLIAYTYMLLFFKGLVQKVEWKKAGEAPMMVMSVWMIYCALEILNPEAPGMNGWIVGVRPYLYMFFSIPLFCMLLTVKSIKTFLKCWGIFTMILTLKGAMQLYIGLDSAERAMMTGPFLGTHLLWGKLRVFSLCSDAGQFGVCQAHAGLVGAILFMGAENLKQKVFYTLMCLTGIYGMFISGTRGALFVVAAGFLVYLALIKKPKLLITGLIFGGMAFGFLKYTTIGESIYEIRRMRTALNPEQDASYLVRVKKQERIKAYLATRPFGGGLGAMADTGTAIPGSFLGSLWSDSGYVLIWGQTGIVGLCLYIGMILFILIKGSWLVWFKIKNEWLRNLLIAMIGGISGVALAHYGNPVMNQHPTCFVLFFSIAVIFVAPRLDIELSKEKDEPKSNHRYGQLQPVRGYLRNAGVHRGLSLPKH